jgi:hypothetical protein
MRRDQPEKTFDGFTAPEELADMIVGLWDRPAAEINGARVWLTDRPSSTGSIDRPA